MSQPLVIIPTYLRTAKDVDVLRTCLKSLRVTTNYDCDVLVIDDGSPVDELVVDASNISNALSMNFIARPINEGFARTVNIGLRRALEQRRDAILCNADIEFVFPHWLSAFEETDGDVVGALLLYPNQTIQHAGVFFSLLNRMFDHIYQHGPHDLPEAQHIRECPVTGALQLIRHKTLEKCGLYDEDFRLGWEDVDYCVRVWLAEGKCVYNPAVKAFHHESYFRGGERADDKIARWTKESWETFIRKHGDVDFLDFIPNLS